MPPKRKLSYKRRKTGGSKVRRRKVVRRKFSHYGGALSDYLPSYETVASYVPSASSIPGYSYLPAASSIPGYSTYQGAKKAYNIAKEVSSVFDDKPEEKEPIIETVNPPDAFLESKKMLEQMNAIRATQPKPAPRSKNNIVTTLRKYKPIGTIDKILGEIGVRDSIRNRLGQSKFGRFLIRGADTAIRHGFGHKRRIRRKARGGSKRRVRKVYRRGGSIIV